MDNIALPNPVAPQNSLSALSYGSPMPAPVPGSHITPERIIWAIRTRFSPIRTLTPEILASQLDAWRVGYIRDLAISYDAIEGRDAMIRNVSLKRKMAVARLPWEIIPDDDQPEAAAHKECLEAFYRGLSATSVMDQNEEGGVSLLVRQMADAIGKHYACHEIIWQPSSGSLTAQFRFIPLYFFEARSGRLEMSWWQNAIFLFDNLPAPPVR